MKDWLPWAMLVFGAMTVWAVIYWKSEDFRKATVGSLLVAKTFTGVYALTGLDRVVFTLYLVHRSTGVVKPIHITECETLFLSFPSVLAFTLAWPMLREKLPREIRSVYEVYEE